jgi:hypothetical protein
MSTYWPSSVSASSIVDQFQNKIADPTQSAQRATHAAGTRAGSGRRRRVAATTCERDDTAAEPRFKSAIVDTGDRARAVPSWHVIIGQSGVWRSDTPTPGPNRVHEEGIFPIAIQDQDGNPVPRFIRSRWSRAEQGHVENVELMCPACSASLTARDVPLRRVRMFSCQISCPRCARGTIVCGSKRTLLMALRLLIDERGYHSRGGPALPLGPTQADKESARRDSVRTRSRSGHCWYSPGTARSPGTGH